MGLVLGYLDETLLVITDFVIAIFGTLFSFAIFVYPNFVIDFCVGIFFFFVTIFFFFGSGALVVYVNIAKSILWRFLWLYLSYRLVFGTFYLVLDFDYEPFNVLKDFVLLKLFLLDLNFVFLGFSVFTLFLFVSKLLFVFLGLLVETDL